MQVALCADGDLGVLAVWESGFGLVGNVVPRKKGVRREREYGALLVRREGDGRVGVCSVCSAVSGVGEWRVCLLDGLACVGWCALWGLGGCWRLKGGCFAGLVILLID